MKVLVLHPDMTAQMVEAPDELRARSTWLKASVGGDIEHVTFLKMVRNESGFYGERGSMFVNEMGAMGENPLPFNYLATLLYLEASRQRGDNSMGYPASIHGVAVIMPEAER